MIHKLLHVVAGMCLPALALFAQTDPNIVLLQKSGSVKEYPSAHTLVLYDSTDVDVMDSGLSYVTVHKFTKVLTDQGAKELRTIILGYDPLSAAVEFKLLRIYRANGAVETVSAEKIVDYPAPARAIYWGAREKAIEVGRLEPGDAVEMTAFRKGFTYALLADTDDDSRYAPPMRGHFYDIVEFWSGVPVQEKVYRVFIPSSKPLQYEVYNGEVSSYIHFPPTTQTRYKVDVNPQVKEGSADPAFINPTSGIVTKPGKITYCWYKRNIVPFKKEAGMVDNADVAPKLLLSTSPDWYAKGVWFNGVNEDYKSFATTPEVKEKVDELLAGVTDELEKISILTHWCAEEIRYSGISMGEGEGYTLHTGEMTFADRCGVCKDKASMLITMLRAAGFESYPAMTMAGSRIDRVPADQFNHSVTVVKRSSGNWMLLDPTWVPGVRELWSSAEQQQGFLMGIPGGADLMNTPVSPAENHYWKLKGTSTLDESGALEGELTLEAEGQSDALIRRGMNRQYKSALEEYLPGLLNAVSPRAEILSSSMLDFTDLSKPMQIAMKYRIPNYAVVGKDKIVFLPLLARNPFNDGNMAPELATDVSMEKREFGFRMRCSKLVEIEETVMLPKHKKFIHLPKFEAVKGKSASFNGSYMMNGNKLHCSMTHRMEKRVYEADDWPEFRSALVQRKRFSEEPIVLSR